MNFGTMDYTRSVPPSTYLCGRCGVFGCKLWREYNRAADYTELLCCDCAGRVENTDVRAIDAAGKTVWEHGVTHTIGWMVPAVPTENGTTYYSEGALPEVGLRWWTRLPTRIRGFRYEAVLFNSMNRNQRFQVVVAKHVTGDDRLTAQEFGAQHRDPKRHAILYGTKGPFVIRVSRMV